MNSIADQVWKILDTSPCIRRDLTRGLINARALAKYLMKEHKMDTTLDAVVSAIRRYNLERYSDIFSTASKILTQTIISTKSRLANISLIKDSEVQNLLPKLFSVIYYNRGDVLRVIQADESLKILVDEKNLEKVTNLFPKDKIIKIETGIAEINMHLHPEAVNTPGVSAIIANELAMNGINIMETISCVPEMLFFISDEQILKAHQVLYKLCHP